MSEPIGISCGLCALCNFSEFIRYKNINKDIMAGHLEVDKIWQQELYSRLWRFLDIHSIKEMEPFKRYKDTVIDLDSIPLVPIIEITFQRLTDRNEEGDEHVISVYPHTFKFDDGEVCEGAIAEIHLSADLTVNKVYMVM